MSLDDSAMKLVDVREALATRTLPDSDKSILIRVQHPALLAHGLRICDGGGKESVPLQPAVQTRPVVVPVSSVRKTPGDQSVLNRN